MMIDETRGNFYILAVSTYVCCLCSVGKMKENERENSLRQYVISEKRIQ